MKNIFLLLIGLGLAGLVACDKNESVAYPAVDYRHYTDIQLHKTWLYDMDSTALRNFGTDTIVRHYQLKDSVVSTFLDGEGQETFKVFRYIRPLTEEANWSYLNAYLLTYTGTRLEMVDENNLRFIKLVTPVTDNYSWDGNAYFTKGTNVSSDSAIAYYFGWNYVYKDNYASIDYGSSHFDSTVTVMQVDNGSTAPFDPQYFQETIIASEKYAKHIGLIYRKILHLTWQPANSSSSSGYYTDDSYGIEMWMIRE